MMRHFISTEWLESTVEALVRLVEIAGAVVIFVGAAVGFARFCIVGATVRDPSKFSSIRLSFGRFLALGLEFQLASDLLHTAVAPSFAEIGKVAAIAVIRTILNFFLAREIEEERGRLESGARAE